MEILAMILFLIVPVFTIVSFVLTLLQRKQIKALKNLVKHLADEQPSTQRQRSIFDYQLESV